MMVGTWRNDAYEVRALARPATEARAMVVSELSLRGLPTSEHKWGRHLKLWLCVGTVDAERLGEAALEVLAATTGPSMRQAIRMGLLIHGALWPKVETYEQAIEQARVWANAPDGIDRLPELLVLKTRAIAFGDDFTRTARALEAVADAYDHGGEWPMVGPDRLPREFVHGRVRASRRLRVEPSRGWDQ